MMYRLAALAAATALLAGALSAGQPAVAQTVPCTGCAIARQESAAAVRANQAIVRSTLQNTLNSQLQTQSNSLQTQAILQSTQLNAQMASGAAELQQLLMWQQLQLLQIEQREAAAKMKKKAPAKHK